MSRGPDAATLLRRALERSAHAAGCETETRASEATRWASATFTGAQHHLHLEARDDAALAEWLAALPEAELPLRGHLVADLVIAAVARGDGRAQLTLEALTVEA